ncbi:MAG: tandem-95 repeat protein [Candidatus Magnetomorum sp.]|nr:tandem-95 repeat protein [Candidatus Magnetomorum sp.]
MTKGPEDEKNQTLEFILDVDREELFHKLPQITSNGLLTYEPAWDAYGQAIVSVYLKDDGGKDYGGNDSSNIKTFTVSIIWSNQAPSFSKGPDIKVLEDAGLQTVEQWATNIQAGPIEESFQNVSFFVSVDQSNLFDVQPSIASNGTLTFLSKPNANGKALVNVFLKDDGGTDFGGQDQSKTQAFFIDVKAVNDPPSFTGGADQSATQNSSMKLVTAWAKNISTGPPDEAEQHIQFVVTSDNPDLFSSTPVILSNGALMYTPAEDTYGNAVVTVYLMDNGGTYDNGDDTSENYLFNITIHAVNHAPFFTPGDHIEIAEDNGYAVFENWASEINAGTPEESYQSLTFFAYANPPTLFSQQPVITSNGTISFETAPDVNGLATIRIFLQDNGGTDNGGMDQSEEYSLKINITPVNDAPRPISETLTIEEDTPFVYTLTAIDIEKDPIQYALFLLPQKGKLVLENASTGRCIYTPYTDTVGADRFLFQAVDPMEQSEPATITLIILPVNDSPQITKINNQTTIEDIPTAPIDFFVSDTDSSFDQLSLVITSSNQALIPDENIAVQGSAGQRSLILTPEPNQHGIAIITLRISDDTGSYSETSFEFNVQKRNDPPTLSSIDRQMIYEDQTTPPISFSINDSETPVADLEIQVIPSDTDMIPLENIQLFGVDVMRTLTLTPAANASGEVMITVTVFDEEKESDSKTFILDVVPVNDPPSLSTIETQTIIEDQPSAPIQFSVSDPDSLPEDIQVSATSANSQLIADDQIIISGQGLFRTVQLTPSLNQSGSVRIELKASDGIADSEIMFFIVEITPVNDPPVADAGEAQSVGEGRTVYLDGSASLDPENRIIFYQWSQTSGPQVNLSNSTKAQANFIAPEVSPNGATLMFNLLIIDHESIESNDTVQITIQDMAGQYMIHAIAGDNGKIFPSGQLFVPEYTSKTFSIAADPNYDIQDVLINGKSMGPIEDYIFQNISDDMTIHAIFIAKPIIVARAEGGGQIAPSGTVVVNRGDQVAFSITPNDGYKIDYIMIDDTVIGPKTDFYFWDVQFDHEMTAVFISDGIHVETVAGKRGTIDPAGKIPIASGSDLTVQIIPDDGYQVDDVQINGTSIGAVTRHILHNILADTRIYATFRPIVAQTIIASSGENGHISPEGDIKVADGLAQSFTMIPDVNYQVADVFIDYQSIGPVDHYTFPSVERDYQINVTFTHKPKITAQAGPNGLIDPSGEIFVNQGWYQEFYIAPNDHYEVKDVIVNDASIGNVSGFVFLEVTDDLSIQAEFQPMPVIRASTDNNGKIIPSGTLIVPSNSFQQFRIVPDDGYTFDRLEVNGGHQAMLENQKVFTVSGVSQDYTIQAFFELDQYTINARSGENGLVSPTGSINVLGRESMTCLFIPEPGYEVSQVMVDSKNVGRLLTYTFDTIIKNHTIVVNFIKKPVITAQAGEHGQIYPQGQFEVHNGDFQMFMIKPDTGYKVQSIFVDDQPVSVKVDQIESQNLWKSYTFPNIEEDHHISVSFNRCQIQTSANGNGHIEPDKDLVFDVHDNVNFSFIPNSGFVVDDVIVDKTSIGAQSYYNFWKLTDDHTIEVNFRAIEIHTLTATASAGGSITPSGIIKVLDGEYGEFMIDPDDMFELTDVLANGKSILETSGDDTINVLPVGKEGYFISLDISSDQTIKAIFTEIPEYEIMAIAGTGGTIEPSGFLNIRHGQYQLFTFKPNPGYAVKDVQVDSASLGPMNSYSFSVMSNHNLIVSFKPINTRSIKGTVVDREAPERGLANFIVEVWQGDRLFQTAITNINGEYDIKNLPATDQLVMAAWPPLGTADYYGRFYNDKKDRRDADPLSTLTGNLDNIRFMMQRTFEEGIRGQVRDGTKGIAYAMVDVFEDSATFVKNVMTDENGFYTLTGLDPSEDYKVSVWYRPYATEYFYALPDFVKPGEAKPDYSVLSWDRARLLRSQYPPLSDIDIVIDPGAMIQGIVSLPDGSPAQGIRVNAQRDLDQTGNGALTDVFGQYTITGLKPVFGDTAETDGYIVEIQPVDYPYMAYPQATSLSQAVRVETGRTDINFQLKKGHHIFGTIHTADGNPAYNVQITAWSLDDPDTKNGMTVSDSSGLYTIANLPIASDYIVSAMSDQYPMMYYPDVYQINTATTINLLSNSAAGIDVTLSKGAVIKGQIFVQQELGTLKIIEGIWVNIWSESTQTGGDVITNAIGRYEKTGLNPDADDYIVSIIHPDYQPAFYKETPDSDLMNDTVYQWENAGNISPAIEFYAIDRNLVLDKGVSFSGRVTFENTPIANVTVELFSDETGGWGSTVSSDRTDSNVIITGLIPGIYTIKTRSDKYADTWVMDVNLTQSIMDYTIQLQTPNRRITGTVVGLAAGEIVRVNAWSKTASCNGFVEVSGSGFSSHFAIEGLKPASDYILETSSNQYPRQIYDGRNRMEAADRIDVSVHDASGVVFRFEKKGICLIAGDIIFPEDVQEGTSVRIEAWSESTDTLLEKTVIWPDNAIGQAIHYTLSGNAPSDDYQVRILSDPFIDLYYPQAISLSDAQMVNTLTNGQMNTVHFTLQRGTALSGKVVDSENMGIHHIDIIAWSDLLGTGSQTQTTADGSFLLSGLPKASDYRIEIMDSHLGKFYYNQNQSVRERMQASLIDTHLGDVFDIDIHMDAGKNIQGHVTDQQGKSLSGIWVDAWSVSSQSGNGVFTDSEGKFDIPGLAEANDYRVQVLPEHLYLPDEKDTITAPCDTIDFRLQATVGYRIRGTVTGSNQKPVQLARIDIQSVHQKQAYGWAMTMADGSYNIPQIPSANDYVLTILPPSSAEDAYLRLTGISITADKTLNIQLHPELRFSGTLINKNTQTPVSNASVIVFSVSTGFWNETLSNNDGIYSIRHVPSGSDYMVIVNAPNYLEIKQTGLTPGVDINFALEPGGTIFGEVKLASTGKGMPYVPVEVYSVSNAGLSDYGGIATTDANGQYRISQLKINDHKGYAIDDYAVFIYPDGYPLQSRGNKSADETVNFVVAGGESNQSVGTVQIPENASVIVDVFENDGAFVTCVQVMDSGDFIIEGLHANKKYQYRLIAVISGVSEPLIQWSGENDMGVNDREDAAAYGVPSILYFQFQTDTRKRTHETVTKTPVETVFNLAGGPGPVENLRSSSHAFQIIATRKRASVTASGPDSVSNDPTVSVAWDPPSTGSDNLAGYYGLFTTENSLTIDKFNTVSKPPIRTRKITSHDLEGDDVSYYFHVAAVDKQGRIGQTTSIAFRIDTVPPTNVSVVAPDVTSQRNIQLTLGAGGASEMYISNDSYQAGGNWEKLSQNREWQLTPANGDKPIYVRFRDKAGNLSQIMTRTAYTQALPKYTIQLTAGEHGVLSPSGTLVKEKGETLSVTFLPDQNYRVYRLTIDGKAMSSNTSEYVFQNITADHRLAVIFEKALFKVVTGSGDHGTIEPAGEVIVEKGQSQAFMITPESGYAVDQLLLDMVPVAWTDNPFMLSNISEGHQIFVTFTRSYTLTAQTDDHGTIIPSGTIAVGDGHHQSFEIVPDKGYGIDQVLVNHEAVDVRQNTLTLYNIQQMYDIQVSFKKIYYTVQSISGANGSLLPEGNINVEKDSLAVFHIQADDGFVLDQLLIDGMSVSSGHTDRYTFTTITSNHTIAATFQSQKYSIHAEAGAYGTVQPSGDIAVNWGESTIFIVEPISGYAVDQVLLDNQPVSLIAGYYYTLTNISANHTFAVTFKRVYQIAVISGSNGQVSPSGRVLVEKNHDQSFELIPDDRFELDRLQIDDTYVDTEGLAYTFVSVVHDHQLIATYRPVPVQITATSGLNGVISPAGVITYTMGKPVTFLLKADPGYEVSALTVDGVSRPYTNNRYVFDSVGQAHQIEVNFQVFNYAPTVSDSFFSLDEDSSLCGVLKGKDDDGDLLTFERLSSPEYGTVLITNPANGSFCYTPNENAFGTDQFTFQAHDTGKVSNIGTVTVTIQPENDPPKALNDHWIVVEDTLFSAQLKGMDVDNDPLTYTLVENNAPGQAILVDASTGEIKYQPDPNQTGDDRIRFQVTDGSFVSDIATISIQIQAVNDFPVAHSTSVETGRGQPLTITLTASDIENDPLQYNITALPVHGTLTVLNMPVIVYQPNTEFIGTDTIEFSVYDGTNSSNTAILSIVIGTISAITQEDKPVTLTVQAGATLVNDPSHGTLEWVNDSLIYTPFQDYTGYDTLRYKKYGETIIREIVIKIDAVNDAPVITPMSSIIVPEDTWKAITIVVHDPDGDVLMYTSSKPQQGTIMGSGPVYQYYPPENYHGPDSFQVTVSDGQLERSIQIPITVSPQNDPPVISQMQVIELKEDQFIELSITATDVDNNTLSLHIIVNPSHGILQGNTPDMMHMTYMAEANFEGWDTFTCKVTDGIAWSNPRQISIRVLGVNDAPVAKATHVNGIENTAITGQLEGTDIEHQALIYEVITQTQNGLVSITPTTGVFLYSPEKDFVGSDQFSFAVSDGYIQSQPVTVTLSIAQGNHPPVGQSGTMQVTEDESALYTLLATDVNEDVLTFHIKTQGTLGQVQLLNAQNGHCKYIPHANKNGTDIFTFVANDGLMDSDITTVTVEISSVNDAPVAIDGTLLTDEDFEKMGTFQASDMEGDALTFSIVEQGSKGNATLINEHLGTYRYDPYANQNGTDVFQFRVSDGQNISLAGTVNVIIQPQNDAPVARALSFQTIEDTTITGVLQATDIDGDALTFIQVDEPDALSKGILDITDAQLGTFSYYPPQDQSGYFVFAYYVTDGIAMSASVPLTIQVAPGNDAPIVFNQALSTETDLQLFITLSGYDIDTDPLIFSIVQSPKKGQLTKIGNEWRYTPEPGFQGLISFSYQADDQSGSETALSNVGFINIRVGVPDADIYTQEDNPVSVDFLAGTDHSANDVSAYQVTVLPNHGTLMGTGPSRTYLPESDYSGMDGFTFNYTVSGQHYTGEIQIYIIPINDPPRMTGFLPSPAFTYEDQPLTMTVSVVDPDTPLSSLAFSLIQHPQHGQMSINGQILNYMPSQNFNGNDQIIVSVTDGFVGSSSSQVIDIQIAPSNDAPVAFEQHIETLEETQVNIALQAVDQESDPLMFTIVQKPLYGEVLGQSPIFTYVPGQNFFGTDHLTFIASDGVSTSKETQVTLIVKNINDPPRANSGSFKSSDTNSIEGRLTALDRDGDIMTYSLIQQPQKGLFVLINPVTGRFVYYPHANASGLDTFSFKVNDGTADSNAALVNITLASDTTTHQFVDLRIQLLDPYIQLDEYTYMFIDADTGQMIINGDNLTNTVDVTLPKGDYRLLIIAANYLPFEYERQENRQKYFECYEDQQLDITLTRKEAFNPHPPDVDLSYMLTPSGIKIWAVKKNMGGNDQFYMHIQTASGEIPVSRQDITGDGSSNAPYAYQWTPSDPWTSATGNTYEVEFLFYGGAYGYAEKIDQITITWRQNIIDRNRSVSTDDATAFTEKYGHSPLYISQGSSEFYPLAGTVCHTTLMDNQGIDRHLSIHIPAIPLEYLYIDDADGSGGQLGYNAQTDQFQPSPYNQLTKIQPDDKLGIAVNYYTFGPSNAGNGVSLSFYIAEGPFAGKPVRYNPILLDSRMENAPLISLPIYLNPTSEILSSISDLSKLSLEILVNEQGDGVQGFRSEKGSTTVEEDGLVFVEMNHLTLVGLDVIIDTPTPAASGDGGSSGCFIDGLGNTSSPRWHEIIGFVFICVLIGLILRIKKMAR